MRLAVALATVSLLLAPGSVQAQEEPRKDIDTAFNEAVKALLRGDGEVAAADFGDIVDNRWEELNPRGRHGAATLHMFALLLEDREEEARARGTRLHELMPEVFYPLGREGAPEVARALCVVSLRTGKNSSLLYVHNRSDKDLTISGTRYEVSYGYQTSSNSVGDVTTDGSPAFPGTLAIPAGKGVIVTSPAAPGGLLAMAVADVVCVLAAQSQTLHPQWIFLTMESYTQTLKRLRIVAKTVRWGQAALEDVVLFDFTADVAAGPSDGEKGR